MNRDAQARLTISSPLEAHKANTLVYHVVGVDVGFENPTFACLEIDYEVSSYFLIQTSGKSYCITYQNHVLLTAVHYTNHLRISSCIPTHLTGIAITL